MISTVHFILLLICFTFTLIIFTLFCSAVFNLVLFSLVPGFAPTSLWFYNLTDFHWPGTLLSFPSISLQHTDPPQIRVSGGYTFTTRASQSSIGFSLGPTHYLHLPANLIPTLGPSADQGHKWPQIHHKGLKIYQSEFYQIHSVSPIPFYNIMATESVTLNQCTFIFYLVVHISAFLDHLTFDRVDILLYYGNDLYGFVCTLFQS